MVFRGTNVDSHLEETISRFPSHLIEMERQSGYLNASTKERRHRNQISKEHRREQTPEVRKIETDHGHKPKHAEEIIRTRETMKGELTQGNSRSCFRHVNISKFIYSFQTVLRPAPC